MKTQRIEKMIYGGAGVTADGEVLPFVLPGELVQLQSNNALDIVERSPNRVEPRCIHFGTCGGCHYQHGSYAAQIEIKKQLLWETLTGAGVCELPEIIAHAGDPWQYRNRIRLRVGDLDGATRVGYNRAGSTGGAAMLPVTMCPISAPLLWRAAEAVVNLAGAHVAVRTWLSSAIEIELLTSGDESELQLVLFTRKPPASGFASLCKTLQALVPELTGAGVALLPKHASPQGRRFERVRAGEQWGRPGLIYGVGDDRHWVSRGAFFQVNRFLVTELTRLAVGERSGALAWDLYAGVGLFSRALTANFEQVVAVEAGQPAATDLAIALKGKPHRALAMTALEFLKTAAVQRERPELIVMDPPRSGVGAEACELLARVGAGEIVYVSCDPVTLARDVAILADKGYTVSEAHLVDMFPQTFHMETVAVLRR